MRSFGQRIERDGGKVIGTIVAKQRARLSVLGCGGLQVLVGDVDLLLQGVQLPILKNLPPIAAEILIVGLSRFPILNLFIGGRSIRGWRVVFGSDGTSGHRE